MSLYDIKYYTYRNAIFSQCGVIPTQCTHKQNCSHVIETLDPLSPLGPLTANIDDPIDLPLHVEGSFNDAGCHDARTKHILL